MVAGGDFNGGKARPTMLGGATATVVVHNYIAPPAARRAHTSANAIGGNLHEVGLRRAKSVGHKEGPQLSPKSFCQQGGGAR